MGVFCVILEKLPWTMLCRHFGLNFETNRKSKRRGKINCGNNLEISDQYISSKGHEVKPHREWNLLILGEAVAHARDDSHPIGIGHPTFPWQHISKFLKNGRFESPSLLKICSTDLLFSIEILHANGKSGYFATDWGYILYIIPLLLASLGSDEISTIIVGSCGSEFCARCALIIGNLKNFSSTIDRATTFVLFKISYGNAIYWNFNTHFHDNRLFWISVTFGISFIWKPLTI